jgi:ferredoxin-NADP reductase/uncharacterized protein YcbX
MPSPERVLVGRVATLMRYPVKSMAGETVPQVRLARRSGMPGDRLWVVRNEETGVFVSGKRNAGIMQLAAAGLTPVPGARTERVQIVFPDGRIIASDDPWLDAALTATLGQRVSLQARRPARERGFYRLARPMGAAEMKHLLGLRHDEPLPDLSIYPLGMLYSATRYASPPGLLVDAGALHLVTTASLDALKAWDPACDPDPRRFRPNILVETGTYAEGFAEAHWVGCTLVAGTCRLRVTVPTLRCSMPGQSQPGLAADPALLGSMQQAAGQRVGVYLEVVQPGEISTGDAIWLERPRAKGYVGRAARQINAKLKRAAISLALANAPHSATPAAGPPGYRRWRIIEQVAEAGDVCSFRLEPIGNAVPMRPLPGQHLVLAVPAGPGGETLYRAYSLSGPPDVRSCRVTVRRQGIVSGWLHENAHPGREIMALGPRGAFTLFPADARPLLLVATGIGITPFMAFLHAAAQCNPQRRIILLYGIRHRGDYAFSAELDHLAQRLPDLEIQYRASSEGARLSPQDVIAAASCLDRPVVALCGHGAFMEEVQAALAQSDVPVANILSESFGGPAGAADRIDATITFRRSGRTVAWAAEWASILDAAEASGIALPSGCRYGACQTCAMRLLDGAVTHPDRLVARPDPPMILACCALPQGEIVLDI